MKERYKFCAASYVILIKNNKIVLQRRYNTGYADGKYTLPSGHIEENEDVIHAAKRECEEEAGVKIEEKDLKLVMVYQDKGIDNTYFDFFCLANNWEGEPYIKEPSKCDELIWCDINKLPEKTLKNVKKAIYNYLNNISFEYGEKEIM